MSDSATRDTAALPENVRAALTSEDKRLRRLFADRETADAVLAEVEDGGRACSHGPDCQLPWSVHDWSYEADCAN